jgi:hypothetical protein
LVCINRDAVPERLLATSEKYDKDKPFGAQQSVRVHLGVGQNGEQLFEDFDFDLSKEGLSTLKTKRPEVYAMFCATKTYLMSQPGNVMSQRTVRTTKIAVPEARHLTTVEYLAEATDKDNRKAVTTTKKKRKALATIGDELGVSVVVDGVDVVAAEKERGQRIHYCAYCKQTLTRPCKKLKCQNIRNGKALPKDTDDDTEEDKNTEEDKPEVNTMIEVNIENGKGRTKSVSTFYCTIQSYEDDGAVFLLTQDGEVMNIFLEDVTWQKIFKCTECNEYGHFALSCDACGTMRPESI